MFKSIRFISLLLVIIFMLAACNLPSRAPATEEPNAVFTAAALTVQAMSTQATPFNTPTLPPPPATNTAVSFPTLPRPTSTSAVPPTAACDLASFIKDISIPDGSVFTPGAAFTKTWRLRNRGTCTWSSNYRLVFLRGSDLSSPASMTLPASVFTVRSMRVC